MALKKPSEYFKKKESLGSVDETVRGFVKEPEINTFSEAFDSFKNNLNKIEVLSDFSETLDNYRVNIERVNYLSEKIDDIQVEVKNLLTKEDLDRAMMSQLLIVEKSINDIQNKVKYINESKITEVRADVSQLTKTVNDFLANEVPRYKKLVVESELRTNNRYKELEENVNQTLEGIGELVDGKYLELTNSLQGINEKSLSGILKDFSTLDEKIYELVEEEIPRYKGFIVETGRRVDSKILETEKKVEEKLKIADKTFEEKIKNIEESFNKFDESTEQKIENIQTSLNEFIEIESPKYNKILIENKLKTEEEVKIIQKNISEKVSQFVKDIETLKSSALTETKNINLFVEEKINEFNLILDETQKDVKKTLSTYTSISKLFEDKVTADNEKVNSYESTLNNFSQKIENCLSNINFFREEIEKRSQIEDEWRNILKEELVKRFKEHENIVNKEVCLVEESINKQVSNLQDNILRSEEDIKLQNKNLQEVIDFVQNDLDKRVTDLQVEIVRNESHIKTQNKSLEVIQEEVKNTLERINFDEIEKQNYDLGQKIKYLEEVFEKISEKEILTENIIVEPPSSDNKDPLTPLNKNFVTLEQLQEHYRLFINRIQQQLATIGGGGETRLKYLDDIVGIATNASAYDGKFLKYNHSIGKFEFVTVSGGGGGSGESYWVSTNAGIHTTSNVGIATTNPISELSVGTFYGVDTTISGISTTIATTIDSFSATTFRSSRLQIQITQGMNYQATDLLAIHDGNLVSIIEYGSIATNDYLGSFNGIVSGGNVLVRVTMNDASPATIKVVSNKITS